jgi:chemotaxis protein MotB
VADQPIIIKKIKKKGHEHHGGAWKLAYADFVTAMMAFFLLMWLLSSTTPDQKKGISEYFQDPYKISLNGGEDVGDRTQVESQGGRDITSDDPGQVEDKTAEAAALQQLEQLKKTIEEMINTKPEMNEFKDQINLEITPEGLRILITDKDNRPMFQLASSATEEHIKEILRALGSTINGLPNKISINGHTDSRPFPENQSGYTNWELSGDRANAARQELIDGGLEEQKILRVSGLSSSIPLNTDDPNDPINRRISIIVMNKKTEMNIIDSLGGAPSTTVPTETTEPTETTVPTETTEPAELNVELPTAPAANPAELQ